MLVLLTAGVELRIGQTWLVRAPHPAWPHTQAVRWYAIPNIDLHASGDIH
ncbi:hypothetical protein LPH50_02450 [Xylella taiwanensis]|nr:hypothetical protein [Xylella taiwanensis]UFN10313.1 hypothetical protein LPH45_02340 [Xylella taiwanensis]UFN17182.1 hypothetical protein LPH50_02450 [Xylella taiwanensis]UFN19433.1 hypothetical protein LPH64_02455 [Xylella taiwanensis]UFN28410.1 hypothetical protein LPH51_02530 [Xylella taiwanensis]UFN30655.1 hypothetical protein LPH46_02520 [Xylella taiwanensis]